MPPFEKIESVANVGDLFKGHKNGKKVVFCLDDSKLIISVFACWVIFHAFCYHLLTFY